MILGPAIFALSAHAALVGILAGPFVGSFLGVLIDRLPRGAPVLAARSVCRHCGRRLGWRDLVPLVSWAAARGRCRGCGAALGWFYPAVELAATAIAALVWLSIGDTDPRIVWASDALGWTLLALAWIDLRAFLLPDALTLPLIAAGLLAAYANDAAASRDHLIGAVAGYGAFRVIAVAYRALRGQAGLGGGDAKLMAAAGAWLGWQGLPSMLVIAAFAGLGTALVMRPGAGLRLDAAVPFGPALAIALFVTWLFGPLSYS